MLNQLLTVYGGFVCCETILCVVGDCVLHSLETWVAGSIPDGVTGNFH